jgi:hypothetical protein
VEFFYYHNIYHITIIHNMENRLDYHLHKFEKQIEFHKGLHLFEMEMNPDFSSKVVFLKESQRDYINGLFGDNKNIQESYQRKFEGNIILESTFNAKEEINNFFSFLKESFVNEINKSNVLNEQTPKPTAPVKKPQPNVMSQQAKQYALNIMGLLRKAFDGVGTDEVLAKKTIFMIKDKQTLDFINSIIAKQITPKYPKIKSLKDWINDEMSDIDRNSYKALWDHLGKLGYKGYNKNDFLAATGKGDVVGMAKAGFKWLKEKGLPWFFEKLREALGSTVGAILQQLLDYTGIGAIGVSILWAVLTLFDVAQLSSGIGSWAKLFFSVIGLLTAGALAKTVGGFLKPFFSSTGGKLSSFFASIAEKPWFVKYIKPITGWIGSKVGAASSLLTKAGEWVVEKLGATTIGGYVTKAAQWLSSIAEGIVKWAGAGAKAETQTLAKAEIQTGGQKLIDKAIKDKAKDYGKEKVAQGAGYVGGEKAKTAVELGYDVSNLKTDRQTLANDLSQAKLGKVVKSGTKVYKDVAGVVDKSQQIAGVNQPKGGVKKPTQNLG